MWIHAPTSGSGTRVHPGGLQDVRDHCGSGALTQGETSGKTPRSGRCLRKGRPTPLQTAGRPGPVATAAKSEHVCGREGAARRQPPRFEAGARGDGHSAPRSRYVPYVCFLLSRCPFSVFSFHRFDFDEPRHDVLQIDPIWVLSNFSNLEVDVFNQFGKSLVIISSILFCPILSLLPSWDPHYPALRLFNTIHKMSSLCSF